MATDPRFIRSQLLRFKSLPSFPDEPEELNEVLAAYSDTCENDAQVLVMINHLLQTREFFPSPASVYKASEILGQQRALESTPNYRYDPGETGHALGEEMDTEAVAKWRAIAQPPPPGKEEGRREKAKRAVAAGMLENYYRRHPESRP